MEQILVRHATCTQGSFCRTSEVLIADEIRLFKALAYNLTDAFTKKKVLGGVHH